MGLIYEALFQNGKKYIGQTTKTLDVRIKQHISKSKNANSHQLFSNAIKKYGKDSIEWTILAKDIDTLIELNNTEQFYISFYNTFHGRGYNMTSGGDGVKAQFYT